MSSPRNKAILLAVVMVTSTAVLLPATDDATAQSSGVPVEFEPSDLNTAELHFWREGGSQTSDCQVNATEDDDPNFCQARLASPSESSSLNPTRETREVRDTGLLAPENSSTITRFMMDTDGNGGMRGQGAEFPATIDGGAQAIQYSFWVDGDRNCETDGLPGSNNPLEVTMQLRRSNEGDPFSGSILSQTQATEVVCPGGTGISPNNAIQVTQSINLDQPIELDTNETLIVEIYGSTIDQPGNQDNMGIFFEDTSFESKVVLRTDQVLEQAVWTTDATGTLKTSFNPTAPESERVLEGRFALRSAFGEQAVPSSGFDGEIEDPDEETVDLFPSIEGKQSSVEYETIDGLESNHGAKKVFRFGQRDEIRPWQYPDGVRSGPYTLHARGNVLDENLDLTSPVAMGAFDFKIEPIAEETTSHDLRPGTSTTFLLRLSNDGTTDDVYELDTTFDFSEPQGAAQWTIDLVGADQNDRVSLDAGESALIRVTLTPPSEASPGDAARVEVAATSSASDSTKSLNLQGTITQQTSRSVRVLVFQEDPFEVGVDRTSQFSVFAWNRGTAVDSVSASLVNDSFDPNDPNQFTARLPQKTFSNVAPGAVASVPIEVTTTDEVSRDQELKFNVEVASQNVPEEADTEQITAVVDAIRDFDVFALDGTNDEALKSTRFGKFNITGAPGGGVGGDDARDCGSSDDGSDFYQRNCRDYSNWTFHRFEIENNGDLAETFELNVLGGVNLTSHFDSEPREGEDGCTPVLQELRFDEDDTGLVTEIPIDNPGSDDVEAGTVDIPAGQSQVVYLRVAYDGATPIWDDVDGEADACKWEAYEPSIQIALTNSTITKTLDTRTKIYTLHPGDNNMEENARGRLALDDGATRNGTFVELPAFSGVQPGTEELIPFTLSVQSGHYDPANVTLGPRNVVEDLRDDGWTLELVPPRPRPSTSPGMAC